MTKRSDTTVEGLLQNRRWLRRSKPFPHVVAQNVFVDSTYRKLDSAFCRLLRLEGSDSGNVRFARNMPGYDAMGLSFGPDVPEPFALFFSRPWHDLLAGLFGVNATGHMSGGLHHHGIGSASGNIHTDLNPGWFVDYERKDGIVVADSGSCNYGSGKTSLPNVRPRETVRAVSLIFYLSNPDWTPGDGGATGLYRTEDDGIANPVAVIPPINNSLLVFECTPYSFHGFLTNTRHERNCLVMWLHRSKDEVVSRWGDRSIVYWK